MESPSGQLAEQAQRSLRLSLPPSRPSRLECQRLPLLGGETIHPGPPTLQAALSPQGDSSGVLPWMLLRDSLDSLRGSVVGKLLRPLDDRPSELVHVTLEFGFARTLWHVVDDATCNRQK